MPKLSETYNLQAVHPGIASEWHPSKNDNLKPNELTPGSKRKIWWQCKNGHEWQTAVYNRSRGSGCPQCYKEGIVKGKPVLSSGLLAQWHPTMNNGLNPRNLTATYTKKLWWLCPIGHEWQATLKSRLNGEGCPDCVQKNGDTQPSQATVIKRRRKQPRISFFRIEDTDLPDSYSETDFRKEKRYPHQMSVMAETYRHDHLIYASMKNFSPSGMYIETDYPISDGERIVVHVKEKLTASSPKSFKCRVQWCNELRDDDGNKTGYRIGLQFINP